MKINTKFDIGEWVFIYSIYPEYPKDNGKEYKKNDKKEKCYLLYDKIKITSFRFSINETKTYGLDIYGYNKYKYYKSSYYAVKTFTQLKKIVAANIFGKHKPIKIILKNVSKSQKITLY